MAKVVNTVSDRKGYGKDQTYLKRARKKKNTFGSSHPINNEQNARRLVEHITERLEAYKDARDALVKRLSDIDIQVSGFVNPETPEDKVRDKLNKKGHAPRPIKHNLPLTAAQIEDSVSYLLSVFAPNGDIFEAVAPPAQQDLAKALTRHINQNGIRVNYYGELQRFLTNALRYNIAGLETTWETHKGVVWANTPAGAAMPETGTIWEGNYLKNLDMYNFIFDASVHPTQLARKGEFYASIEMANLFRLRKMEADDLLYNVHMLVGKVESGQTRYYKNKPSIRAHGGDSDQSPNWVNLLRGGNSEETKPGYELVHYTGWISPADFGISDKEDLSLYKIVMANSSTICSVIELEGSSGMLPIAVACPIMDDLDNEQRTYAERLIPLQHFASFLLNSHQDSVRKSLGGLKLYDPRAVGLREREHDDLYSAAVPLKQTGMNIDIDKVFRSYNDAPKTENNVADISRVNDIMQKILPTDMLRQVADIDRATTFQAAATVVAGSRRMLLIARVIAAQAFVTLKLQMIYNIYAKQQMIEVMMPDGQKTMVDPSMLREAKVELDIAGGMKGLDRMVVSFVINDVLNKVIQSQQAINEIDIVSLIDYYTSVMGDDTDITAFRRQTPAPAMPGTAPEGSSPVTPGQPEGQPILE